MKSRPSTIENLAAVDMSQILDYLSAADLNNIKAITRSDKNPFVPKHFSYANSRHQTRWQRLARLHFPHFLDGLSASIDIPDWKHFFIQCCENSYITIDNVKPDRLIKLFILVRGGHIDGLKAEQLQLNELSMTLAGSNESLGQVAFGNQELSNYIYNEIIIPAYKRNIINLSDLLFSSIAYSQPLETIKQIATEMIPLLENPRYISFVSALEEAIKRGHLEAIEYMVSIIGLNSFSIIFFSRLARLACLNTAKFICNKYSDWLHHACGSSVLAAAAKNLNPGVFEYFYELNNNKSPVKIDGYLLETMLDYLSISSFNNLCRQADSNEPSIIAFKSNFIQEIRNLIESNPLRNNKKNHFDKIKSLLKNENNFAELSKDDYLNLARVVVQNVNAPIFKDLLEIIFEKIDIKLTTDTLFSILIDAFFTHPLPEHGNAYAIEMLFEDVFYHRLTIQHKHFLFSTALFSPNWISDNFNIIKKLYLILSKDEKFHTQDVSLGRSKAEYFLPSQAHVLEFLLAQGLMSYSSSVFAAAVSESKSQWFKHFVNLQAAFAPNGREDYILSEMRDALAFMDLALLIEFFNHFPDIAPNFVPEINESMRSGKGHFLCSLLNTKYATTAVIEHLLEAGIDPTIPCVNKSLPFEPHLTTLFFPLNVIVYKWGSIPLDNQEAKDQADECFSLLVAYGADIHTALAATTFPTDFNQLEFFISKGADINMLDVNQSTLLDKTIRPLLLGNNYHQTPSIIEYLLNNGANIKLALTCVYRRHYNTSVSSWNDLGMYQFQYLSGLYEKEHGFNKQIITNDNLLIKLLDYIKKVLLRRDDDYHASFNFFGYKIRLSQQRSALEKRKASHALLAVFLGIEPHESLKVYQADLIQGDLSKIYNDWVHLNKLESLFITSKKLKP